MFCRYCANPISDSDSHCPQCGAPTGNRPRGRKSRILAGLLAIFLGSLGIHNFYLGYASRALAQLLITAIGGLVTAGVAPVVVWVWSLFEAVQIFTGRINHDGRGNPLNG